ncbi:MAG: flagellar basal-body rod protein FlgG [Chitinivibrionales bacterium]|nr:flagellar basal-body rod protein FlgG [Chitinivibrionales bacterium]
MIRSMYTAATGMEAQQLFMDTISHNLANVNTNGYKRSKVEFQDLMYQTLKEPGLQTPEGEVAPVGIEVGLGVKPGATQRLFDQGSLTQTTNPLDVAIQGLGFFQIQQPDGSTAYSRDGTFKLSADGTLVTSSGYVVDPQITVPQGVQSFTIDQWGKVSAVLPGKDTSTELGQLEIANFTNPAGLASVGGNLLVATEASGEPIVGVPGENGLGKLQQGYTEASNVQVVDEMVNMISAQRAYEIVSKSIQVSDEMLQTANNLKR